MKKILRMNKLTVLCAILLLIMSIVAGCATNSNQVNEINHSNEDVSSVQPTGETKGILVSAAASLSVVMDDIIAQFEAEHSDIVVEVNYGSSGALQKQIEQGAPADLFVSAGMKQMKALEDQGLLEKSTPLLKNEMVIVANREIVEIALVDNVPLKQLLNEVKPTFIAIGEPDTVPAGQYAKQVLQHEQLWDVWNEQYVYAKDVRQVLTYVEQGNAELGFVYLSDAVSSDKVDIIHHIDTATHDPITYPVATLKSSKQTEAAQLFFDYLLSEELNVLYEQNGFKRAE
ncbi:molybdate ABC transporter substrate-binding protein [Paenibacillus endoradicis]|uniref:molybdate ABC transporter substrate-binding protein n=1 Tax=Paenibacillus endoradicis TaxID=2972487 RepID=UPI0021598320|nr:molybdate ABC transporter substrate-binding protein [Paenibacillus endoradicis]MCR8659971.1 molybdate ABC transporter substrate-binding protein [Paenibacillus endoradicis]